MDEIQFNFKDCENEVDRSNALMQWLVNRAFQFDKSKYDTICLRLGDNPQSCVAIEMCFIISAFSNIKFYVPRKDAKKCRCYYKNKIIIPVSMRKWEKMTTKLSTMHWDSQQTNDIYNGHEGAMIFYRINYDTVKSIAVNLYGWLDDRKQYIYCLKKAIKDAKKQIKKEQKQAKEIVKDADTNNQR